MDQRQAGSMEEDRISQLPEPILHLILSLLPQKAAVQTCLLSKSWRYLGLTRPKFEFEESFFRGSREKFISVVGNTLQRYVDQKLSLQEFVLETSWQPADPQLFSLLHEWIPIVIMNLGVVKKFKLTANDFPLPSVVLQAQFLTELYLSGCKLNQIDNNNCINVKLHMLKRLNLWEVSIEDVTFEKIMSSCPLIQHLVLCSCRGLSTIKVNKARNLKLLDCNSFTEIDSIEISDDAPSLETIRITRCRNIWSHMHDNSNNNYIFPRLKSLYLWNVHLPTESFGNLSSNNCPCLEKLELRHCSGFTEINLSNRSIKFLVIETSCFHPINAVNIDVANILYFKFRSGYLPSIISFSTTSRECKSHIEVWPSLNFDGDAFPTWLLKLHEFLKAIRQSQISLHVSQVHLRNQDTYDGDSCEPVVVEHLCVMEHYHSRSKFLTLLNCLFRICRPIYIQLPSYSNSQILCGSQLPESILETLERQLVLKKSNVRIPESKLETLERQLVFKKSNIRIPESILETLERQQDLKKSNIRVSDKNRTTSWKLLLVFFPLCFFFIILCCWFVLSYVRIEEVDDNHLVEL